MIEKTIKLYTIDELSEEAKKRAIKDHSEINMGYPWWNFIYDSLVEEAKTLGFDIKKDRDKGGKTPNIYFSLYTQGSGVCFEYEMSFDSILEHYVDKTGWADGKLAFVKKYCSFFIDANHNDRYTFPEGTTHNIEDLNYNYSDLLSVRIENWAESIRITVVAKYLEICKKYYKLIEEEDEYFCSDEAIIESLRADDYLFLENGKEL